MKLFLPPHRIVLNTRKSVFLGGTIDMGNSENWQQKVVNFFKNKNINFYNPRRKEWDNSWKQTFDNPQFFQQVTWELDALKKADIIVFNFLKDSKSPITFLELGLYAASGKVMVCCPKGFYRRGNVEIVCNQFDIPMFETMNDLIFELKNKI